MSLIHTELQKATDEQIVAAIIDRRGDEWCRRYLAPAETKKT